VAELFAPTLREQIECVQRELKMRYRVYPERVSRKLMRREKAEREIEVMQAVHRTLLQLAGEER